MGAKECDNEVKVGFSYGEEENNNRAPHEDDLRPSARLKTKTTRPILLVMNSARQQETVQDAEEGVPDVVKICQFWQNPWGGTNGTRQHRSPE